MWVINSAVGCHYFPPGLQLPSQPLRGLLPILLLGKQRHNWCKQFAYDCYRTASQLRFEPGPCCAWVQHANHSATEPPICGLVTTKDNDEEMISHRHVFRLPVPVFLGFLQRDAMLARVLAMALCLSQVVVLSNWSGFWHWGFFRPVIHCVIRKFRYILYKK